MADARRGREGTNPSCWADREAEHDRDRARRRRTTKGHRNAEPPRPGDATRGATDARTAEAGRCGAGRDRRPDRRGRAMRCGVRPTPERPRAGDATRGATDAEPPRPGALTLGATDVRAHASGSLCGRRLGCDVMPRCLSACGRGCGCAGRLKVLGRDLSRDFGFVRVFAARRVVLFWLRLTAQPQLGGYKLDGLSLAWRWRGWSRAAAKARGAVPCGRSAR